jgi:serine/threonine-protein kinase
MTFAHLTDWEGAVADIRGTLHSPCGVFPAADTFVSLKEMRASRTLLLLLAAAGVLQLAHYSPELPEVVASHFDGAGRPNGFQSRNGFAVFSAAMLALTLVVFGGLGPLFRKIPTRWFNLPNRDYWLSPERREETIETLSAQLEWYGAATLALYLIVIQMVIETNRMTEPSLDSRSVWIVLGVYFLFTAVWTTRFILRFRRP